MCYHSRVMNHDLAVREGFRNKTREPGWCHAWPDGSSRRQRLVNDLINELATKAVLGQPNGVAIIELQSAFGPIFMSILHQL